MKKALLIAAVTLAAGSAYASKARLSALSGAAHLSDVQNVFTKPHTAATSGEWVTTEFGDASTSTTRGTAEGGFNRKMDNAGWGLYLGSSTGTAGAQNYRNAWNATGANDFGNVDNALNVYYGADAGDLAWGAGLLYSKSEFKPNTTAVGTPGLSQDAMGVMVSASSNQGWDANLSLGLGNNAKRDTGAAATDYSMKGSTTVGLNGGYWMDTMYVYAGYTQGGAKVENNAVTVMDRKDNTISVGVVNSHKKEGTDFFYGVSYNMQTLKDDATGTSASLDATAGAGYAGADVEKIEITTFPLLVGLESEVNSWMTARASLKQNVLLDSTKITYGTASDKMSGTGNTSVAAGVGLKFGKLTFDGTLSAASSATGTFGTDGGNFLAATSFTYMF